MEKRFRLRQYGSRLWSREKARQVRDRLAMITKAIEIGDVVVVDAAGVEVFDFSFAAELFCKTILSLGLESPGRFVIVENLTEYAKENLEKALESLNLAIIERAQGKLNLLGKVHQADHETFLAIIGAGGAVSSGALSRDLGTTLTATNERLSKLTGMGVLRREKGSSASGREQYVYKALC